MSRPVIPEAETQWRLSGICGRSRLASAQSVGRRDDGFDSMMEVPDSLGSDLGFRDDG